MQVAFGDEHSPPQVASVGLLESITMLQPIEIGSPLPSLHPAEQPQFTVMPSFARCAIKVVTRSPGPFGPNTNAVPSVARISRLVRAANSWFFMPARTAVVAVTGDTSVAGAAGGVDALSQALTDSTSITARPNQGIDDIPPPPPRSPRTLMQLLPHAFASGTGRTEASKSPAATSLNSSIGPICADDTPSKPASRTKSFGLRNVPNRMSNSGRSE